MRVSLIGFMGAGKSTVGKELAKTLGFKVLEMDQLIIEKSGKKDIAGIFEEGGELLFREIEIKVAKSLQNKKNVVISTGGGVVMNKIIVDYLKQNDGVVVHLDTSIADVLRRQPQLETRPLFKDVNKASQLFNLRKPLYEEYADYRVVTEGKSVLEITEEILKLLGKEDI